MSIWGAEPFQDDASFDYMADLMESLADSISKALCSKSRWMGTVYFVRSVAEILYLIGDKFKIQPAQKNVIEEWMQQISIIVEEAKMGGRFEAMDAELQLRLNALLRKLLEISA
jgi:hypothetical protein